MRIHKLGLLAILTMVSASANSFVVGGSNLPLMKYPEFNSYEPTPPYSHDKWDYDRYRNEVEQYVREAKEYVENAANDQKRAQESAEEAIDKANRVVEEFNSWARGY